MAIIAESGSIALVCVRNLEIVPVSTISMFGFSFMLAILAASAICISIWKSLMNCGGGENAIRLQMEKEDLEWAEERRLRAEMDSRRFVANLAELFVVRK